MEPSYLFVALVITIFDSAFRAKPGVSRYTPGVYTGDVFSFLRRSQFIDDLFVLPGYHAFRRRGKKTLGKINELRVVRDGGRYTPGVYFGPRGRVDHKEAGEEGEKHRRD